MTGSEIYSTLAASPGFQKQFPMLHTYGTPVKPMTRQLIGREKQLRQLKAGLLRPELCNVLLLGEAGSGKALANDTLIPVDDSRGYVAIADLKQGDYVFDENGQRTAVLGVFPQGEIPAYRVRFEDGAEIVCNDEHLWNVQKDNSDAYETLTLKEIMAQFEAGHMFSIPLNKSLQRETAVDTLIHPYAAGVILISGHVDRSPAFSISSGDEYVAKKVAELIGATKAKRVGNMRQWCFEDPNPIPRSKYIRRDAIFGALGLSDDDFEDMSVRRIPESYMRGSALQRLELLQGLMDAGGVVRKNKDNCTCAITIKNGERFAKDIQALVRSLGMRARLLVSPKNAKNEVTYTVSVIAPNVRKYDITTLPRYKERFEDLTELPDYGLRIEAIEDLNNSVPMTCIYVDSPSHLFQAGKEHIVTHNTALVQGAMAADRSRVYLEIDLSKMIADLRDNNEMAVKIKALFDEAAKFVRESQTEIVLFIDEFHLICMLSDAAVEALKPQLADSGTRGVRVIVATTFTEFREYISANQPLVQRLQRIEILPPSKEAIVSILKSFAKIYGVADEIHGTYLYEQIIDLSNRYIPANSQPRKSILLLDLMVGWYRAEPGTKMDINLLYEVLKYSEGIELNVSVDAVGIKKRLDSKVFAQYLATSAVASRLQITSADLNNKTKPMGSFLFTGSTGKLTIRKPCLSREG